jgi:SRSO17 transposase
MRIRENRINTLGSECWLILRHNLDGAELVAALSNAPVDLTPELLEQVHALHGAHQHDLLDQHNAIGLAGYETRSWRGWNHHITLCLLADAFRLQLQQMEQ